MPDLPTLTVTQAQADRILAAFDNDPGAYTSWIRRQLVEFVVTNEQARMQADALDAQRTAVTALRAELETT